ncbi:hypothetical protein SHELI_v1c09530 [Spiroplasma helicoides]|uniref:Uncharacterized protein n=1 Tax=Spiroplasma helicoides TaxID=216938 RepID=A0A1B3SLU3_9MOLU|nr:hypothetical protein [Spiroplasma helicoides]AOG60902.1 hypothetical protein SHELI_v1c09530 [Spiroplasma helicoides]
MLKGTAHLNLLKIDRTIEIVTSKFQKSTFDQYLIASIIKNTNNENDAIELIFSITGKGSLYDFFINKYTEMKEEFDIEEIEKIILNSLIPIKLIKNLNYSYIPSLDLTIFKRQYFKGNVFEEENFIKESIDQDETFIKSSFKNDGIENNSTDSYQFKVDNDEIFLRLDPNKSDYFIIQHEDFENYITKNLDIDLKGLQVKNDLIDGEFKQLNDFDVDMITNKFHYEHNDKIILLNEEFAKEVMICLKYQNYWLYENKLRYEDKTKVDLFNQILESLLLNNGWNEIKNKILIKLISSSSDSKLKCEVVNKLLLVKNSPEITKLGLKLIEENGTELKNIWDFQSLEVMYESFENLNQLINIYQINDKLKLAEKDLVEIYHRHKSILSDKDLLAAQNYINNCKSLSDEISRMLGDMSRSGVRENMKQLDMNDENLIKLKKFYNKNIAHNKKTIDSKDIFKLQQTFEEVKYYKNINDIVAEQIKNKGIKKSNNNSSKKKKNKKR